MVEYGGWDMPVEYSGITDEHLAVRTAAGLFDVSHMGEIEIAGADSLAAVQWITSNDASRLAIGQIQYSALTTPTGGFVDDVLVYRLAESHYLLVVNAANIVKDHDWIGSQVKAHGGDVAVVNSSSRYALIALQGPTSASILQPLTGVDLAALRYYWFATGEVAGVRVTISRTGYTGEDGFEIFVGPEHAEPLWRRLIETGREKGIQPAGLGARDTLRLEAKMCLYGNDMDETTSLVEAGLGWIVSLDEAKGDFPGRGVLAAQKKEGAPRKLVGFEVTGRGIARHGYAVFLDGKPVGPVTSGSYAPYLQKNIGLCYVPAARATAGTNLEIDVRGRNVPARVVPTPFYKRTKQ